MNQKQYKASDRNVIRGQRFVPVLNGPGHAIPGSLVATRQQLIRAEDSSGHVNLWQVTLSPVFRNEVGPVVQGQPQRGAAGDGTGLYLVTMRWGGGGVSYQTDFQYPASGASFCVAGDNVMLEIAPQDFFTAFTEQNKPCVNAWVAPGGLPTTDHPLVDEEIVGGGGIGGIIAISPWARTLTLTKATPGATVLVELSLGVVNTFTAVANMGAADQRLEIPIPSRAIQARITPSAGGVFAMQTLDFT